MVSDSDRKLNLLAAKVHDLKISPTPQETLVHASWMSFWSAIEIGSFDGGGDRGRARRAARDGTGTRAANANRAWRFKLYANQFLFLDRWIFSVGRQINNISRVVVVVPRTEFLPARVSFAVVAGCCNTRCIPTRIMTSWLFNTCVRCNWCVVRISDGAAAASVLRSRVSKRRDREKFDAQLANEKYSSTVRVKY